MKCLTYLALLILLLPVGCTEEAPSQSGNPSQVGTKQDMDEGDVASNTTPSSTPLSFPKLLTLASRIRSGSPYGVDHVPYQLYSHLRPGLTRKQIHTLLGPPNQLNLKRTWRFVNDVEGYRFEGAPGGAFIAYIAYQSDVVIDNIEDSVRIGGSKYSPEAPWRIHARKRLEDLGEYSKYLQLLKNSQKDESIWAARCLARFNDRRAIAVLAEALETNNFPVWGSENATIHEICLRTLIETLEVKTGQRFQGDRIDFVKACREWLSRTGE